MRTDRAHTPCGALFNTILARERRGDTTGAINAELDELGDRCAAQYQIFADYVSIKGFADVGAAGACSEYADYDVKPAAVRLARTDGLCSTKPQAESNASPAWRCNYSPTFNRDWHDDIVCSDGTNQERPYLRGWDDFVTRAEIIDSARKYESRLNGE